MSKKIEKLETMTVGEVLNALGISRSTLNRRIENGEISPLPKAPGLKRHYKLEFLKSDIEQVLESSASLLKH